MSVSTAYLSLGSNLGDRAANLLRAVSTLVASGIYLSALSSIYETDPVDHLDQPAFLNLAIAVNVGDHDPFSLLDLCLKTEARLGRRRIITRGPRTIDIDLLLFDDRIIEEARGGLDLILPHPRMHRRRFVLAPMAEIAPDHRHPHIGKTMSMLLNEVDDQSAVRVYKM